MNPQTPHGRPNSGSRPRSSHAGDLGNIGVGSPKAEEETHLNGYSRRYRGGIVSFEKHAHGITLGDGGPSDVVNRTVVIHADPDDFGQPTGNAGARLACGVIRPSPEQASFIFGVNANPGEYLFTAFA